MHRLQGQPVRGAGTTAQGRDCLLDNRGAEHREGLTGSRVSPYACVRDDETVPHVDTSRQGMLSYAPCPPCPGQCRATRGHRGTLVTVTERELCLFCRSEPSHPGSCSALTLLIKRKKYHPVGHQSPKAPKR